MRYKAHQKYLVKRKKRGLKKKNKAINDEHNPNNGFRRSQEHKASKILKRNLFRKALAEVKKAGEL